MRNEIKSPRCCLFSYLRANVCHPYFCWWSEMKCNYGTFTALSHLTLQSACLFLFIFYHDRTDVCMYVTTFMGKILPKDKIPFC